MTDLEFAQSINKLDITKALEKCEDFNLFYKFSPYRGTFLSCVDFKPTDIVYEISNCYGMTSSYCQNVNEIHKSANNDELKINSILYGDKIKKLNKETKFNKIILAKPVDDIMSFVVEHMKMLVKDGEMILAIPNKYSLSAFAGKPSHDEKYFETITENWSYSRNELVNILKKLNLDYCFYYPLPNFEFANEIYSDEFLPSEGEISNTKIHYGKERVVLFDEDKALNDAIKNGEFTTFAPSFVVVIKQK